MKVIEIVALMNGMENGEQLFSDFIKTAENLDHTISDISKLSIDTVEKEERKTMTPKQYGQHLMKKKLGKRKRCY